MAQIKTMAATSTKGMNSSRSEEGADAAADGSGNRPAPDAGALDGSGASDSGNSVTARVSHSRGMFR
jgi:hypothetical protein